MDRRTASEETLHRIGERSGNGVGIVIRPPRLPLSEGIDVAAAAPGDPVGIAAVLAPVFAVGLALVHVFADRLRGLNSVPRSRWLSLSAGVAVAYVFVHLLPEIQSAGVAIERSANPPATMEHHVYLITLLGFVSFYGLERFALEFDDGGESPEADEPGAVFWLHVGSFGVYNVIIGYLLVHKVDLGPVSLTTYFVAMALHFLVNDYGLRKHHGRTYHRYGRWLLATAVLGGLLVGYATEMSELVVSVAFAFIAGSIVLNVIKEELPSERRSRFWAFAVGVTGYSLLLLAM